ncbi:MAG TPA: sigma-70 family RNA polymerase sigma factor [Pirellulales bacterium]|nr:sigma-70 family RNA polymerase sigma factor [Pirellulales bacterium]
MTRSLTVDGEPPPRGTDGKSAHAREAKLLAALRRGEQAAAETLVREHGPYLLVIARRYLKCELDSADAVQEAFASAFQAMPRFSGESSLRTWLHRIVVNACLMKIRTSARRPTVSIDALCPQFDGQGQRIESAALWVDPPADALVSAELRAQVRGCIDQLPDDFRTVLLLRDIDELDTRETAALLGVSAAVVKTRLHRARQALRSLLVPILAASSANPVTEPPPRHPNIGR